MLKEIQEFTKAINAVIPSPENKYYSIFKPMLKRANYFLLNNKFPLVVKLNRTEKPFWGLPKKIVDLWKGYDYFLVLLESNNEGWVFSETEVNSFINNKEWKLPEKGRDYKIHPASFLRNNRFNSSEEFLKRWEKLTNYSGILKNKGSYLKN